MSISEFKAPAIGLPASRRRADIEPTIADRTTQPRSGTGASAGSEGLSQFLARVLDQLSVSSWLPSGVLVAGALLYFGLAEHHGDLGSTVTALTHVGGPQLAIGIGLVVISTVVTQAFEFQAIRTLEGYWGPGRARTWLSGRCCRFQLWRRRRLEARMARLKAEALDMAIVRLRKLGWSLKVIVVFRAIERAQDTDRFNEGLVAKAQDIDWRDHAPLEKIRGYFALGQYLDRCPPEHRQTLPTRLGNVLRSYEIAADDGHGDLEGLAQRLYDKIPLHLQASHDTFRSRLDLYCTMVFVLLLGVVAAPALWTTDVATSWAAGITSLVLVVLCYRAAIASAAGYGQVLKEAADHVRMEAKD